MKKFFCSLFLLSFISHAHSQIITTICGDGVSSYAGDGQPAIDAQVQLPISICSDTSGNLYFLDALNNALRKITVGSTLVYTIAGGTSAGYAGDGGLAVDAYLNHPASVAVDKSGNIYIADFGNNAIRKVDVSGVISTVAGDGTSGYFGDGGAATVAKLNSPMGVAVDDTGNIIIADTYNHRVRKVSTSGVISTIAGNGVSGYLGDGGTASLASFDLPTSLTVAPNGDLIIADYNNKRIRQINTVSGIITTCAGNGIGGNSGDGGPAINAKISQPICVSSDINGDIYITDQFSSVIRKVKMTTGIISTIAGNGTQGFSGDGASATAAQLNFPSAACTSPDGKSIFITDKINSRIRKVADPSFVNDNGIFGPENLIVFPNPTSRNVSVTTRDGEIINSVSIFSIWGVKLDSFIVKPAKSITVDLSNFGSGTYFAVVDYSNYAKQSRVIIQKI